MRIVEDEEDFAETFAGAAREAEAAFNDGAIYLERVANARVVGTLFSQCYSYAFGGAIYAAACGLEVRSCTFDHTGAAQGGAIC